MGLLRAASVWEAELSGVDGGSIYSVLLWTLFREDESEGPGLHSWTHHFPPEWSSHYHWPGLMVIESPQWVLGLTFNSIFITCMYV